MNTIMPDKQLYTIRISFASERLSNNFPYPLSLIENIEQSGLFNPLKQALAKGTATLSIVSLLSIPQYPIWGSQGISYAKCEQIIQEIKDLRPF